jgi:FkbM family methyltransferase
MPFLQPLFERLYRVALSGMNCGGRAGNLRLSGETYFLSRLARFYPKSTVPTLVDAGAHMGDYSLAFAESFSSHIGFRVLALEPSPVLYPEMQKRLQTLDGSHRFETLAVGLGEKKNSVTLYAASDPQHAGLTSLYQRRLDHFKIDMKAQATITLEALDVLAETQKLEHIHLLKLDIEGHELSALHGAQNLIRQERIDFLQFEFGGCNIDSRTYFQDFYYLLSPHFELYRVLPHGLQHIDRYREEQEIFITTNFIAVRKALHADFLRH